jgi:hypothetical protein
MIDVEPLIATELERMLPLPHGSRADWSDVVRRAGSTGAVRRWRPLLVAAIAVVALVGVGVAIAASLGAFRGISAAQHPRTAADKLSPAVVAEIRQTNKLRTRLSARLNRGGRGLIEPDTSRLVRRFRDGIRVFAVAATGGELCVVIEGMPRLGANVKLGGGSLGCTSQLTQKVPSTVESFRAWKGPHGESPAISWGITLDGATGVSFPVNRRITITVPVKDNVWVYIGRWSAAVRGFTVHFKDGHTQTIP